MEAIHTSNGSSREGRVTLGQKLDELALNISAAAARRSCGLNFTVTSSRMLLQQVLFQMERPHLDPEAYRFRNDQLPFREHMEGALMLAVCSTLDHIVGSNSPVDQRRRS